MDTNELLKHLLQDLETNRAPFLSPQTCLIILLAAKKKGLNTSGIEWVENYPTKPCG